MSMLKWDESPYWHKKTGLAVIEKPEAEYIEPELPRLVTPYTKKEITEAILDDPRYNAMNPSNQQHIIDLAIASARKSAMLIEDD